MTYRLVVGSNAEPFTDYHKAVVAYTRAITTHPYEHVLLIEGEELPGIPPKVIAEKFGREPKDNEPQYVGP